MTRPPVSKTARTSDSAAKASPAGAVPDAARQMAAFEQAMKLFHARKLKEARDLFHQAAAGPERDVAQRAKLHIAMCDRRLQQATVSLGSAEDYYNYGIALINSRNLSEARAHLEKGVQISPGSDHIHYALAVAQALSGDLNAAHDSLRRAIEIDPRNRIAARQDTDFAPFVNQSPFSGLLFPERK
ncbi:MAG TPA: tetratricopeptide repeat protein [Verrucomicrobiae bacterium]|nr:tetratricopeptide repeat protein [Verrucomicrobiae bacterium]